MNLLRRSRTPAVCFFALIQSINIAIAAPFSISPLRVSMSPDMQTSTVEIRSGDFANPILIQVTPYNWSEEGGERILTEATDLQVYPAVFKLEPGAKTDILLRRENSQDTPRYYRLKIEELQTQTGDTQPSQLAFLRIFDIPVFVESPQVKPKLTTAAVVTNDGRVRVDISNEGDAFFAATSFRMVNLQDASNIFTEHSELSYVLPGSKRSIYFEPDMAIDGIDLNPPSDTKNDSLESSKTSPSLEDLAVSVMDIKGKHAFTIPLLRVE